MYRPRLKGSRFDREAFLRLWKQGLTDKVIATRLGTETSTVVHYRTKYGLQANKAEYP